MSRGPGWLQRAVIEHLGTGDGHVGVQELARLLCDDGEHPPRSLEVSLRRAARGLERRGLVRTGYRPLDRDSREYWPLTLQVWLPEAEAQVRPQLQLRRRWVDDDAVVLRVLREIGPGDVDAWLAGGPRRRGYGPVGARHWPYPRAEPPWVPYQLAAARVADAIGARDRLKHISTGGAGAIKRGMQRLARRGLIEIASASPSRQRTIDAIKCF